MFHFKLKHGLIDHINLTPNNNTFKKLIIYLQAPEAVGYSAPVLQFWKPLSGFLYCFWLLPSPDQPDLASRFGWWLKKPVHFSSWTWNQWHWQSHVYPRNEWKQNVRTNLEIEYKFSKMEYEPNPTAPCHWTSAQVRQQHSQYYQSQQLLIFTRWVFLFVFYCILKIKPC